MDPNTCTREDFTKALTSPDLPSDAAEKWTELAEKLRGLLNKLAYHPAMASNLQQTYMTPAASKNKIYFTWDFVGRTLVSCPYESAQSPVVQGIEKPRQG